MKGYGDQKIILKVDEYDHKISLKTMNSFYYNQS